MIANSENCRNDSDDADDIQGILETCQKFEKRKRSNHNLPKFYSTQLTTTLRDRITESLAHSSDDQVSILEELALVRASAGISVDTFSEAYEKWQEDPTNNKLRDQAIICGSVMYDGLEKVIKTAKVASDIRKNAKTSFDIGDLYDVVGQITRLMFEVCGTEHKDIAEKLEYRVENELSFIQSKTRITPDMTVLAMDATVPEFDGDLN